MKLIATVMTLMIALLAFASGQTKIKHKEKNDKAEQEVKRLISELDAAHLSGDAATIDRILAEEFETISFRGAVKKRAQAMAEWNEGKNIYDSYINEDVKVHIHGETAIVTALNTRKSRHDPNNVGQFRTTRVFVKQRGRWQMVASQATRLAQQ